MRVVSLQKRRVKRFDKIAGKISDWAMTNPSQFRTVFNAANLPRHAQNVAYNRMNVSKHEAAVALGSSKSEAKAAAAQKNGTKGGRPEGS
jgi:hypothetical protein